MTIEVTQKKLKELEEASQVIDRIREQIVYMNDNVVKDFDVLAKAVTTLFDEHKHNQKLALMSRNTNFDNFREQLALTTYLSIQDLVSVEFPDPKEQSMDKPFGFVRTLKINNHTMYLERNLNWGEIWTCSNDLLTNMFPDKIVCINDIKLSSDKQDYTLIVSLF
jgi:hypothetical protein